mmetsp:Transcript_9821/g.17786  ORF Transcript_9821/g.17786 Transcript_9821/m.17786 type:complete len:247 (+) Transcript_9821:1586-2326(+)
MAPRLLTRQELPTAGHTTSSWAASTASSVSCSASLAAVSSSAHKSSSPSSRFSSTLSQSNGLPAKLSHAGCAKSSESISGTAAGMSPSVAFAMVLSASAGGCSFRTKDLRRASFGLVGCSTSSLSHRSLKDSSCSSASSRSLALSVALSLRRCRNASMAARRLMALSPVPGSSSAGKGAAFAVTLGFPVSGEGMAPASKSCTSLEESFGRAGAACSTPCFAAMAFCAAACRCRTSHPISSTGNSLT